MKRSCLSCKSLIKLVETLCSAYVLQSVYVIPDRHSTGRCMFYTTTPTPTTMQYYKRVVLASRCPTNVPVLKLLQRSSQTDRQTDRQSDRQTDRQRNQHKTHSMNTKQPAAGEVSIDSKTRDFYTLLTGLNRI